MARRFRTNLSGIGSFIRGGEGNFSERPEKDYEKMYAYESSCDKCRPNFRGNENMQCDACYLIDNDSDYWWHNDRPQFDLTVKKMLPRSISGVLLLERLPLFR